MVMTPRARWKAALNGCDVDLPPCDYCGSPADVCREVEENIALFSGGRGYIVAPCHNIQANTPTENILAPYETVRKRGA